MAQFTYAQLEALWEQAGGSASAAPTAAAIAMAESGGNSQSLNTNASTGDYSVGLWQINYFGSLLSSRTAEFGTPASLQANPAAQAAAAVKLSGNGTNFSPWTTYTGGAYRRYLNGSVTPSSAGITLAASDTSTATSSVNGGDTCVIGWSGIFGTGAFCLLSKTEARALLGGSLLLVGGLIGVLGVITLTFGGALVGAVKADTPVGVAATAVQAAASAPRHSSGATRPQSGLGRHRAPTTPRASSTPSQPGPGRHHRSAPVTARQAVSTPVSP